MSAADVAALVGAVLLVVGLTLGSYAFGLWLRHFLPYDRAGGCREAACPKGSGRRGRSR